MLQHLVLLPDRDGGARVDNDRAGNVRAPLLDTPRDCLLLVSLDEYDEMVHVGWMDGWRMDPLLLSPSCNFVIVGCATTEADVIGLSSRLTKEHQMHPVVDRGTHSDGLTPVCRDGVWCRWGVED